MTTEHQLFRRSKAWQNFRKEMLRTHPYCYFCHSNRSTRIVHHIFNCQTEEEYEDYAYAADRIDYAPVPDFNDDDEEELLDDVAPITNELLNITEVINNAD